MNPSRRRRRSRRTGMRNRLGRFTRRAHANPSYRRVRRRRRVHLNPTYRRAGKTYKTPSMTPAMRRKIGLAVRRSNASRRSNVSIVRRAGSSVRRRYRSFRSSGGGGGSFMSTFRSALSRPLLMKAGGAIVASLGTGYILNKFSASLPLATNPYGRLIYTLGIPVAGAFLVHRKSRDLAEGMIIGGLVMSINSLMQIFNVSSLLPTGTSTTATIGSYSVAGELGQGSYGAYPTSIRDTYALGGSNVAFPTSAW
jgi:hypothetical protein